MGAGKEVILPAQSQGTDAVFDKVLVRQPGPVTHIGDQPGPCGKPTG